MQKAIATFIFAIVLSTILLILSQNALPSSSALFNVKRLKEKVILVSKSSPDDRADYYAHLLDVRLGELRDVVYAKEYSVILSSALRYSTTAGQYTQFLKENDLKEKGTIARNQFQEHQSILKNLLKEYQTRKIKMDSSKFVQDDINYLNLYMKDLP